MWCIFSWIVFAMCMNCTVLISTCKHVSLGTDFICGGKTCLNIWVMEAFSLFPAMKKESFLFLPYHYKARILEVVIVLFLLLEIFLIDRMIKFWVHISVFQVYLYAPFESFISHLVNSRSTEPFHCGKDSIDKSGSMHLQSETRGIRCWKVHCLPNWYCWRKQNDNYTFPYSGYYISIHYSFIIIQNF